MKEAANPFVWRPTEALSAASNAAAFMRALGVSDWPELVRCGDEQPTRFHEALFRHVGLRFRRPYSRMLDESRGPAWAKWCVGGTTNVILNALDRWRGTPTYDKAAIVWEGEDRSRRTLTYRQLDSEVCRLAGGLRALGLSAGDVIAVYMPNVPEAVVAMLAVVKIGGIVMPLFSGFGADAIATRLEIGAAKALICVDGSLRRGKLVDVKAIVDAAALRAPALAHVIVLRRCGVEVAWRAGRDKWWHELCAAQPDEAPTEEMDADAPFLLVFTSGTTGSPKGVVHSHIGFAAKLFIDLWLMLDCKADDRVLWMSDMGWVIGPLLVYGTTLIGATFVLIEGAPNFPDPQRMWRVAAEEKATYLGVAPTTIRTFMAQGGVPCEEFDLSRLRILISAGEAWTPDAWLWCYEKVGGGRLPILNFSGGTEMISIIGSTVLLPLKPAGFNCAVPGAGADIADEDGRSAPPGAVGELVMRRPSIGLTRGLWKDSERYLATYWSTWPNVWHHGDFASRDADGQWYIHGRSDDTMKIAGKRTGPAEIETLLMSTGKLAEAAAVAVPDPIKGSALVLVCSPKPGVAATEALAAELAQAVVEGMGVPFRPGQVIFVSDLPKTRNMKIVRRVIRSVCVGENPGDLSVLANPEAVAELAMQVNCRPVLASRRRGPMRTGLKLLAAAAAMAVGSGGAHAQYSDGVIKIGVLNDQAGLYAHLTGQGSVWAANKAIEDFCKANKCHDKIEIVSADHQNKPDIASSIARQWFDVDKVDVVVDVPTSSVALAVNSLTKEKNKIFLASGPATSDLTGKACTPNTIHWTYDTWALANGTGNAIVKTGGTTWFFVTADYAFGHALERDTAAVVEKSGGKVLGKVRHPFPGQDFSSFLLQAQASKAKIIGLANAGGDTINSIKQAAEFGIVKGGQNLAGLLMFITDVHALGLQAAQGLIFTEAWYWDTSDTNRAFAKEFSAANRGNYPTMIQAGVYSAVTHYLKAVHELRADADGAAVVAKMKSMPTDDKLFGKGMIRADGRKVHPMYLLEVKSPAESKGAWDYYKIRATIPAEEAFRPTAEGGCPLAK